MNKLNNKISTCVLFTHDSFKTQATRTIGQWSHLLIPPNYSTVVRIL